MIRPRPRWCTPSPCPCRARPGSWWRGRWRTCRRGRPGSWSLTLRDPARPVLVTTLGDPDPTDAVATELASGLALAGDFAYVVETHRQRDTGAQEERFTVLDLRDPLAPRRRGTVVLPVVTRSASSTLGTFGAGLTVAGTLPTWRAAPWGSRWSISAIPMRPGWPGVLNTRARPCRSPRRATASMSSTASPPCR